MSDEPTAGTPGAGGGDAAQPTAGTPAIGGGNAAVATETPEQLQQRIVKLEAEKAQHLAEKTGAEADRRRLAELEAQGAAPRITAANPLERIAEEIAEYQGVLAREPNNVAYQRLFRAASEEQRALVWQQFRQAAQPELNAIPEAALREKATRLMDSGQFTSVQGALLAAKGLVAEEAGKSDAARRAADEEARRKGAERPATDTGPGPVTAGAPRTMTNAELTRLLIEKEGTAEARKLIADVESGRIPIKG